MSLGTEKDDRGRDGVPPTDRRLIVAASVCLAIPIVALMAVPTYTREDPKLFGFPFFFWYQLLWVFLCSALTWTAYRLVLAARRHGGRGRGRGKGDS